MSESEKMAYIIGLVRAAQVCEEYVAQCDRAVAENIEPESRRIKGKAARKCAFLIRGLIKAQP